MDRSLLFHLGDQGVRNLRNVMLPGRHRQRIGPHGMDVVESGNQDILPRLPSGFHQIAQTAHGKVIRQIETRSDIRIPFERLLCLFIPDMRKCIDIVMLAQKTEVYPVTVQQFPVTAVRENVPQAFHPEIMLRRIPEEDPEIRTSAIKEITDDFSRGTGNIDLDAAGKTCPVANERPFLFQNVLFECGNSARGADENETVRPSPGQFT